MVCGSLIALMQECVLTTLMEDGCLWTAKRRKGFWAVISYAAYLCAPKTIEVLKQLCRDKNNMVFIVSAKSRNTLCQWFSACENLGIGAEHGFLLRLHKNDERETCVPVVDCSWKRIAESVMKLYTETTDGSTIEDKETSTVWCYENVVEVKPQVIILYISWGLSLRVAHSNLKAANILLDEDLMPHIFDTWLAVLKPLTSNKIKTKVADVKRSIETAQGSDVYPAAHQMLIYQGKVLKDGTTLIENNVVENSLCVIMLSKVHCFTIIW